MSSNILKTSFSHWWKLTSERRKELHLNRIPIFSKNLKNCLFSKKKIQLLTHYIIECTPYPNHGASIVFCDNQFITNLNEKDRHKIGPTDILSYPTYLPNMRFNGVNEDDPVIEILKEERRITFEEEKYLGDIFISQPYIVDYCNSNNTNLNHHMALLLTHGVLHLLGYDHEIEEDYLIMNSKEQEILSKLRHKIGKEEWKELNLLKN
ncbi:hypothetical protein ABK040_006090 [Willaertia magna]